MNFSIYSRAKYIVKEAIYENYLVLEDFPEDYEKITRKKMLERCIEIYKENPDIIFELFNQEELEVLFSLNVDSKVQWDKKYSVLFKTFLLSSEMYDEQLTISEELVDVFNYCKNKYILEKNELEKNKEGYYFIVGLFRTFGALTIKEVNYILKDLNLNYDAMELLHSYYARRFIDLDYYTYDKEYALKELYEYKCDLVATHPKKIRLKYSFNQFVEVGKHYYIKSSPEYRQLTAYPKVFNFYNSIDKNEMLLFKGCGLVSRWFVERFESFLEELNEDEQTICLTFFELLPSYVLIKNQNNILSEEDSELFYKVLLPFLEYVAFAKNLEFDFEDKRFNAHQAYDILQVCIKDNFNIVDNYIEDVNLSLEEKEIVLGLKKFIKGPFIVMKHLNDGSVFAANQNMYLVKGIITPIESMEAITKTPAVCETILIPFKDVITYFSVLAPYPISIGNNMRKQFAKEYKTNKDKIIKSL